MIQRTLGGNRLGSGKKLKIEMKEYERSSHDKGAVWRSSMSAGTLVPFLKEVGLPGDTWDIDLNCEVLTHPTVGPLYGSFKVQLDVFMAPIRLYQKDLQNNKIGIGMNMKNVLFPKLRLTTDFDPTKPTAMQVNPSCILAYLGIRGVGRSDDFTAKRLNRYYNAIPYLMYWDVYKNYYANVQEEIGAVIHSDKPPITQTVTKLEAYTNAVAATIPNAGNAIITANSTTTMVVTYTGTVTSSDYIFVKTDIGEFPINQLYRVVTALTAGTQGWSDKAKPFTVIYSWRYATVNDITNTGVAIEKFPLANIDNMRDSIMGNSSAYALEINNTSPIPYAWPFYIPTAGASALTSQEGLALKTYQSDINQNWIKTETITGPNGVAALSAVSTAGGSFTIDTLNLASKVYNVLNRIAASGGTYYDWVETVWTADTFKMVQTPVYMGGLSKELVFQEVIASSAIDQGTVQQPLGQLGGRGVMASKHKGGKIRVKVSEPCYIMGIVSLTPRIDYSQGNEWDTNLSNMDELHKPELDQIGYQDLITDTLAYWDTKVTTTGVTTFRSAGKQPAWLNYMTAVNQTYGNFAIPENEMFMTLNRRYEVDPPTGNIKDLTTYIDPAKYNYIFAETARDAQNFWVQIGKNITARRKMSAKLIPNL